MQKLRLRTERRSYLCGMRKILLWMMSIVSLCSLPVRAQFNTVALQPDRCRVELQQAGADEPDLSPSATASTQKALTNEDTSVNARKQEWVDRYLSVCYPLRDIRVTSPYGYRKDPFTGKKKFHNGIDLHAQGNQVLAMMEGMVVAVGQDKVSGKYVILRHGNYTISYCHLSKIFVVKGMVVHPRDAVGITGSTGRTTGEHLHITCKLDGGSVDPLSLLEYVKATQQECVAALTKL